MDARPRHPYVPPMDDTKHIQAQYDPDARMWWAESEDVPGLVSEAPTLDALMERVAAVVPELLAANGAAPGPVRLEFHAARILESA